MNSLESIIDLNKYLGMLTEQRSFLYSELSKLRDINILSDEDIERINNKMVEMLKRDFLHLIPTGQNLT